MGLKDLQRVTLNDFSCELSQFEDAEEKRQYLKEEKKCSEKRSMSSDSL